jgi:hypothetical protein
VREQLAPGYPETVASWAKGVARGKEPGPSVAGPAPQQARPSRPLAPLAWWESVWAQLGATVLSVLAFASYPAVALAAPLARLALGRPCAAPRPTTRPTTRRVRLPARLLAAAGLAAVLGFVGYFGYLMFTAAGTVGPVVAGRPLPWLALQALAVGACASALALAASWWSARAEVGGTETARIGALLAGGAVFAAWAAYWGLLLP